jgi:hypothetical protein
MPTKIIVDNWEKKAVLKRIAYQFAVVSPGIFIRQFSADFKSNIIPQIGQRHFH